MGKMLALLSGKGGSGKTTLALSMASMLSDCGIRVLLIDCDLSTNGATYFYEDRLSEHNKDINSFYEMVFGLFNPKGRLISVNENMDFMPSITQVTKKNTETYSYRGDSSKSFNITIRENYRNAYDVIIFDCQAGYTDILKLILPQMDINLVVMEADAISSAAMRSLYLKTGDVLNEKKVYQIFNKATDEEYEIYSKISGGTVFTNIETVRFDWKIRKAFSVAEIPDMKKTSADYGVQIYGICRTLFKEENIQAKLDKYETIVQLNKESERKEMLEEKISELQVGNTKSRRNKMLIGTYTVIVGILVCFLFYLMIEQKILSGIGLDSLSLMTIMATVLMMILVLFCTTILESTKERRGRFRQADVYRKQLEMALDNIQELQIQYKKFEGK